jgi:dTDP-4-amino-4,6-dideoxygalactose transaminase
MSIFKRFRPIASALAPNYTILDVLIAERYLLFPWNWQKWQRGKNARRLERKFCEYMNCRWAVSFDSGRSGFYAILKSLGIKDYDEVILQSFTTVALPNVIRWCGAVPVYVDIDEKTYNIDPEKIEDKITKRTKAIVVQHTFGNPADVDRIMEIAEKHNLYVIEDCAHSLGAEYKGRKTGMFGNAAFFSFGRDKVISSVSGGMAITNNQELGRKIKEFRDQMSYPRKVLIARQLLHPIITFKALKLYHFLGIGKILMFLARNSQILTRAYTRKEKRGERPENFPAKMPNALAEIALHQMKLIDKYNNHRIKIARIYKEKLINNKNIKLPESTSESKNIFLWYTILVKSKKEIIEKARQRHIILGDWFPQAVGPVEVNLEKTGYKKGSCPVAERISSQCVNLPTHHNINVDDVEKIVEFLNL